MNAAQVIQKVITDHFRGVASTPPVSLQVALSTAPILMNGSGISEPPSANGYSRQAVVFGAEAFVNGTGTTIKNSAPIVFGPCTNTDWPPVQYIAVFSNTGTLLAQGNLAAPRVVPVGGSYSLAIDALQILVR
jgi:hypothetical protein